MLNAAAESAPPKFIFSINWKVTLLSVLFLPLLLRLGYWQLERSQEKLSLQLQLDTELAKPRVELLVTAQSPSFSRKIFARGHYLSDRYWLLDNKTRSARVGYEVIVPFQMDDGGVVLVNRGWLQAPGSRDQLPAVSFSPLEQIQGRLYRPTNNTMIDDSGSGSEWPKRVQQLLISQAQLQVDMDLYPAMIRLDGEDSSALITDWKWLNSNADKHRGYALQWFTMAFALVVAWLFASTNLAAVITKPQHNNKTGQV